MLLHSERREEYGLKDTVGKVGLISEIPASSAYSSFRMKSSAEVERLPLVARMEFQVFFLLGNPKNFNFAFEAAAVDVPSANDSFICVEYISRQRICRSTATA
jgi:hypothetical protein